MMPKIVLCVLLLICTVQCVPLKGYTPQVAKISQECATQTQLDVAVIQNFVRTSEMPPASETFQSFLECLYKKQNYFDDKGSISYPTIENYLSQFYNSSVARKAVGSCESIQTGSSLGEKAYNAGICIMANLRAAQEAENTV